MQMALKKSGSIYEALPTPDSVPTMQQGRALKELASERGFVNIVWTVTSKEREQQVLPIRIPIDKGVLGWRLLLVTKGHAEQFKGVKNVEALKAFTAGQGHDWPDTEILQSNGIQVLTSPNFESLFLMLEAGRFHYFPRSLREIWREADQHANQDMMVEPYLALHYPSAHYFFVNKNNTKLAAALRKGLEMAIADGSFDKLFHEYHDKAIKLSDFKNRTIIELKNPGLPVGTPLDRKELWFSPK
jgi:ABC-type amino acid transport substrate-binding protein